jgi:hypothetical protein
LNITLKAKVRHWFNFLRLALKSTDPQVQSNLVQSAQFYEKWGDITSVSFEDWWKSNSYLFHQRQNFEVLSADVHTDEDFLYLKVPYSLSPTAAAKVFTRVYREQQSKRRTGKVKRDYHGEYALTPAEFQAVNFRYYTLFAEKVYVPLLLKTGKKPVTKDMVALAKDKFKTSVSKTESKSYDVKKQRIAPFRQDIDDDYAALSRTATRYRLIVENLIRNVSLGVFPGEYQEDGLKNLYEKRREFSQLAEKKRPGRKRIPRPKGYEVKKKTIDPNNPTDRVFYLK